MSTEAIHVREAAPQSLSDTEAQGVPRGYKRTEVGVIPREWNAGSLRSCLKSAPSYGINAPAVPFDDTLPTYLRITDIGEDHRFQPSPRVSVKSADATSYFLAAGDLVFARTGASVGKSYLYDPKDGPLVFAGFLIRVTPDPSRLQAEFLSYCVQGQRYWDWVANTSARSGQPGINGREYASLQLPLPPLPEQRAIAETLSDVDGLLGALEALIAKKRAIKQAAMQQLLTGKTRLPGFSGEWEMKRLGDHVAFLRHGVNSRAELTPDGAVKYVHYGDIHTTVDVYLEPSSSPMPRLPAVRARTLDRLQDGDLVMVDASEDIEGVGKSVEIKGLRGDEVVSGLHTIAARFDKAVLADGFKAYLQFCPAFRNHLRRLAAGTKVYATSRAHLATVEMQLPQVPEQTAIASALADMDAEITALEARRDKTRAIKQGMMQQLLTGRVRLVKPSPAEAGA
jgi:type I restriction enzyme S subunit